MLATGAGKSMLFQVPAVAATGITVVVSPLVSLMQDQVRGLLLRQVPAVYLSSDMGKKALRKALMQIKSCEAKLVYLSPERLVTSIERDSDSLGSILRGLASEGLISSLVIDEAHCISDWGTDFRQKRSCLEKWRVSFPHIPIRCYTATSTRSAMEQVLMSSHMHNPAVHRSSIDRPNLFMRVMPWTSHDAAVGIMKRLIGEMLDASSTASAIVYCRLKASTTEVAQTLQKSGITACAYHAGLPKAQRRNALESWLSGASSVIVATVACGMGIDHARTRLVIHAGMPSSMERYAQEIGQGGRDGALCQCVALVAASHAGDYLRYTKTPAAQQPIKEFLQYLLSSRVCRRNGLLAYFGESTLAGPCCACDVCVDPYAAGRGAPYPRTTG